MRLMGEKPRVKAQINVETEVRDFLKQLSEKEKRSISLIFETSTIAKFQTEYKEFLEISRKEN